MNPFFVLIQSVLYLVGLYNKKYGVYIKTVRLHQHWGFDSQKKEYVVMSSILKFRRHKYTHVEEVYQDRSFVDSNGGVHQKGWYPLDEYKQQGNYQY